MKPIIPKQSLFPLTKSLKSFRHLGLIDKCVKAQRALPSPDSNQPAPLSLEDVGYQISWCKPGKAGRHPPESVENLRVGTLTHSSPALQLILKTYHNINPLEYRNINSSA